MSESYIKQFDRLLNEGKWNLDLLDRIQNYLDKELHTSRDIDDLLMSCTKLMEVRLRAAVEKKIASRVPNKSRSGIKLLNYAERVQLINDKEEAIYSLLKWIFKEPRNTAHHEFIQFPLTTLVGFMGTFNIALDEIRELVKGSETYSASYYAKYDTDQKMAQILISEIRRPDGQPLSSDAKVEGTIRFKDNRMRTVSCVKTNYGHQGEYNTLGVPYGTASVTLGGFDKDRPFLVASGAIIPIVSPAGSTNPTCPDCGKFLLYVQDLCPKCGKPLLNI